MMILDLCLQIVAIYQQMDFSSRSTKVTITFPHWCVNKPCEWVCLLLLLFVCDDSRPAGWVWRLWWLCWRPHRTPLHVLSACLETWLSGCLSWSVCKWWVKFPSSSWSRMNRASTTWALMRYFSYQYFAKSHNRLKTSPQPWAKGGLMMPWSSGESKTHKFCVIHEKLSISVISFKPSVPLCCVCWHQELWEQLEHIQNAGSCSPPRKEGQEGTTAEPSYCALTRIKETFNIHFNVSVAE